VNTENKTRSIYNREREREKNKKKLARSLLLKVRYLLRANEILHNK